METCLLSFAYLSMENWLQLKGSKCPSSKE